MQSTAASPPKRGRNQHVNTWKLDRLGRSLRHLVEIVTALADRSPMGRVYREATPAMAARVTAALDKGIGRALAVAAYLLRERRDSRAVDGREGLDLGWS